MFFNGGGVRGHSAREYDQFFTDPALAAECIGVLSRALSHPISDFDLVLEPSFGNGAFVVAIQREGVSIDKIALMDIDAAREDYRKDFLTCPVLPEYSSRKLKCLTVGNPPFGKNASLAIAFFNRAAEFSDVIAFVVPRTFSKSSVINRLDAHFVLIEEHILPEHAFTFQGEPYSVPCVFQVWKYSETKRNLIEKVSETDDFVFVNRDDEPDLAVRRVGVNAGRVFDKDVNTRSESSHLFIKIIRKKCVKKITERLNSLGLEKLDSKFHTAGCPSISKSEICIVYNDRFNN